MVGIVRCADEMRSEASYVIDDGGSKVCYPFFVWGPSYLRGNCEDQSEEHVSWPRPGAENDTSFNLIHAHTNQRSRPSRLNTAS